MNNNENNKKSSQEAGSEPATQPNIKRYETDVTGVSMNNLEVGLWVARNKKIFQKAAIVIFAATSFSLAAYGLFGLGYYFFKGMWDDKKMVAEMVSIKTVPYDFLLERSAKNVSLSSLVVTNNGDSYDFYIEMKNPNQKHWGLVSYCFKSGEKDLECGDDFILPGEKKYMTALGLNLKDRPANVRFFIKDLSWRKLDPHKIFDWDAYKNERLKIKIDNITFKSGSASELSEKISLNQLSFSATNQSAYGFWEAPLLIIFYRNERVAGINKYVLKEFASYNQRQVELSLVGDLAGVNKISVVPYINILDDNNYLKPGR
jgi:hypothetical protein